MNLIESCYVDSLVITLPQELGELREKAGVYFFPCSDVVI